MNGKSAKTLGATTVRPSRGEWAFTLIELLAVIAIIGLLAGLVVGLSGIAVTKQRESRMRSEHARLVTAIEAYKAELGSYPPDNTNTTMSAIERAGKNSLFYELSGATFRNDSGGEFTTVHGSETVKVAELEAAFGIRGIQNSARDKRNLPYRGVNFKPSQYAELDMAGDVEILITPLKGPHDATFKTKTGLKVVNPWFYNLTGTNKHNPDGFDLWTEYLAGRRTNVVGNWRDQ